MRSRNALIRASASGSSGSSRTSFANWVARKDGVIDVTPAKTAKTTRARVMIPEHPTLTAALDAAPTTTTAATTLLTRQDGQSWKLDHIKHAMAKAVRAAGLPEGLSFHGLRKGLTAALADTGASDAEIESIIPHADPCMTRVDYPAVSRRPRTY
jgi:integrase